MKKLLFYIWILLCSIQPVLAASESDAIAAIREFEGNQTLAVEIEDETWDAPIPNGHGTREEYRASVLVDDELWAEYGVTAQGTAVVVFVGYESIGSGSPVSEEQAVTIATQYATDKVSGFDAQTYGAEVKNSQTGDYLVVFSRTLANGAKTGVGGCSVFVAPSTGNITGLSVDAGTLSSGQEDPPTISQQDALALARQEYPELSTVEPESANFTLTGEGWLCYELQFPPQGSSSNTPALVVVDANSGELLLVDWWQGGVQTVTAGQPDIDATDPKPAASAAVIGTIVLGLVFLLVLMLFLLRRRAADS